MSGARLVTEVAPYHLKTLKKSSHIALIPFEKIPTEKAPVASLRNQWRLKDKKKCRVENI